MVYKFPYSVNFRFLLSMSATKRDIVSSSSSPNINDPTERLNNFDLRLQALFQDINDSLVCIICHHDENNA